MTLFDRLQNSASRRSFLSGSAYGLGSIALAALFNPRIASAAAGIGLVSPRHFAPKAKRIIYLYMAGGPSHLETLDYKPKLAEMSGKPMPESFTKGQPIAQLQNQALKCLEPQHAFKKFGKSGQELSVLLPHLSEVCDDISIIRTVHTDQFNHGPAQVFINCGSALFGRPSMGAWATYGLGAESKDLPASIAQTTYGGSGDGFVARLTADLTQLDFASYAGGSGDDSFTSIALGTDAIYLTGRSLSKGSNLTALLMVLNSDGNVRYSTSLGEHGTVAFSGIVLSGSQLYLGGTVGAPDYFGAAPPANRKPEYTDGPAVVRVDPNMLIKQ